MFDFLTGKTILLTGATGFIGSHLLRRLVELGNAQIVVLARSPSATLPAEVTVVRAGLDQITEQTWQAANIARIDAILHLGAFTPKTPAEANRVEEICRDNIEGTRALLRSLPSVPERIIFSSTLDVYAPATDDEPIREDSRLGPTGLYGASKLFCEQLVRSIAKEIGCSAAILRYGHIFGPGEEAYGKLIPQMIRTLLAGGAPTLYGDGSAQRDFLYVSDAVEATLRAANTEIPDDDRPLNIVRGASVPIRRIAEALIETTGAQTEIQFLSDRPNGPSLRFDNTRMRTVLGEWPLVSLEEGLHEEVRQLRGIGNASN